tara:strand:- start:505 stop:744 length:240 start_codon:yes stop_codon:yes gene_type:complete
MKLIKQHQGQYKGSIIVDGIKIRLEASSIDGKGFSFTYYANDKMMYDDGWYGLRLKDIKQDINKNIENIVEDYKQNKIY